KDLRVGNNPLFISSRIVDEYISRVSTEYRYSNSYHWIRHLMQQKAPLKIVKASAGSGKTFNLTLHYITLLLHRESSYREILAVTFANNATCEMKHLILSVLRGLSQEDLTTGIALYRVLLMKDNPS